MTQDFGWKYCSPLSCLIWFRSSELLTRINTDALEFSSQRLLGEVSARRQIAGPVPVAPKGGGRGTRRRTFGTVSKSAARRRARPCLLGIPGTLQ